MLNDFIFHRKFASIYWVHNCSLEHVLYKESEPTYESVRGALLKLNAHSMRLHVCRQFFWISSESWCLRFCLQFVLNLFINNFDAMRTVKQLRWGINGVAVVVEYHYQLCFGLTERRRHLFKSTKVGVFNWPHVCISF